MTTHGSERETKTEALPPPIRTWRILAVLLVALVVLSGCGTDFDQVRLCRQYIGAFDDDFRDVTVDRSATRSDDARVRLIYQAPDEDGVPRPHWIECRFADAFFGEGRFDLQGVATDRTGLLSERELFFLRKWHEIVTGERFRWAATGRDRETEQGARTASDGGRSALVPLLYLGQQIVNAITVSCVYGLIAVGFTMVFGIIRRINFAFGEMCTIGAVIAVIGVGASSMIGQSHQAAALIAILVAAMMGTAAYGWAMERLVFRPLRDVPSQSPLVAAIGLSIFLQELIRLLQGTRDRWPTPVFADIWVLAEVPGYAVTMTKGQAVILGVTIALQAALLLLLARSGFGRVQRACTDDMRMASLLGIDVGRTIALTFVVGTAYAAAAGTIVALYYGGVNFYMGFQIGFKALVAAIVGGIGVVPGAVLGGVVIGVLETFWSAYFNIAYKDIAVFGLLTLFLLLRPQGLLGKAKGRGD